MASRWDGVSQGLMNAMQMYGQYQGLQRQRELADQQNQEFQWKKDRQAYDAETQRQQGALADEMQRGAIDNGKVAAKLNATQNPDGAPGVEQWTPQQVGALTRGPGSAFDPNAGPALPNGEDVRTPMKGSEVQARIGALSLRRGDMAGATAAQQNARTFAVDEGVQEYMREYDKNPEMYNDHLVKSANLGTKSLSVVKEKNGYYSAHVIDTTGAATAVKLDGTKVRSLALAEAYIRAGAYDRGLQTASGVSKELAEAIARDNGLTMQVTAANNTATHYANADARGQAQLALSARVANAQVARANEPKQYPIEYEDGRRGVFIPKSFDQDGVAILPKGARYILEDGQRQGKTGFDPVAYAKVLRDLSQSMDPVEARIQADQMFGRGPQDGALIDRLKQLNGGAAPAQPQQGALTRQPPRQVSFDEFNALAAQAGYQRVQQGRTFVYKKPGMRGQGELSPQDMAAQLGVTY